MTIKPYSFRSRGLRSCSWSKRLFLKTKGTFMNIRNVPTLEAVDSVWIDKKRKLNMWRKGCPFWKKKWTKKDSFTYKGIVDSYETRNHIPGESSVCGLYKSTVTWAWPLPLGMMPYLWTWWKNAERRGASHIVESWHWTQWVFTVSDTDKV